MLTIRLARVGKTKQAQYRMVVADHRRAVTGRFIDVVGNVNPLTDPATVTLKKDEISQWLEKGAQPSETVRTILVREDILKAPANQPQRPSKAPKRADRYGKAEATASTDPATPETPPAAEEIKTDDAKTGAEATAEEPAEVAAEPDEAQTPPEEPENGDTES